MTNKLPTITKKQSQIIQLLFRFRFLNRSHIQKLLHHKDEARINHWLKDLTQKEYISRNYVPTFPENTKPAIYHLATGGIAYLKTQKTIQPTELQKLYRENKRSDSFIATSLLLADIYLNLNARPEATATFSVFVRSDFVCLKEALLLQSLSPSAYIRQETAGTAKVYLLEILGNIPLEHQRRRLKQYLSFYQSCEWEGATSEPFPTVLIICPSSETLASIKRFARTKLKQIDEPEIKIHLATAENIKARGLTGDIWQPVTYKSDV